MSIFRPNSYRFLLLVIILGCYHTGHTQKQKKNKLQFFKLSEDDDYLNFRGEGTDRGYTSGLKLEFYYTKNTKPKFPSNLLMHIGENADNIYGWGLTQNMYTPSEINVRGIQYGDRPYCGATYFSNILISSDKEKKQKLTTGLSFGLLGKYSFAGDIQTWVHGLIRYQKPLGWDNQIRTDIILNYAIEYEHMLFSPTSNLEIIGGIHGNAGTFYNNMGAGIQFRAGLFNNYFTNYERPTFNAGVANGSMRRFQFFFYMKTLGTAVMDNSTLQGGFFSHNSSPYVIAKDSVNRFYMQYEYGIVIAKNRVGFCIAEKLRTPEFKGTYAPQTGNVTFYFGL